MVEKILIVFIVIAFLCLLFLNIIVRVKVLKTYKILVQNRVKFNATDIFNSNTMKEVCKQNPEFEKEIMQFTGNIKNSVNLAIGLIFLISALGAVLMYFRKG